VTIGRFFGLMTFAFGMILMHNVSIATGLQACRLARVDATN
jgi:hypothetical protein